jgi:hypothetical protein
LKKARNPENNTKNKIGPEIQKINTKMNRARNPKNKKNEKGPGCTI